MTVRMLTYKAVSWIDSIAAHILEQSYGLFVRVKMYFQSNLPHELSLCWPETMCCSLPAGLFQARPQTRKMSEEQSLKIPEFFTPLEHGWLPGSLPTLSRNRLNRVYSHINTDHRITCAQSTSNIVNGNSTVLARCARTNLIGSPSSRKHVEDSI